MKKILIFSLISICIGYGLYLYSNRNYVIVTVDYDNNINKLPISMLKNLRYLSKEEKKKLFTRIRVNGYFSIDIALKKLSDLTLKNMNIILWFTNHQGDVMYKGANWYKKNIFDAVNNASIWLADLTAWRFFSAKEVDLLACEDFINWKNKLNDTNNVSSYSFINSYCKIVSDDTVVDPKFNILRSANFFWWLSKLEGSIQSFGEDFFAMFGRKDVRKGAAHFSLKQVGYYAKFLDYKPDVFSKNLLEIDQTQLFPILQYLEGLYYACNIVEHCKNNLDCTIVFLLPNKEFTYYMHDKEAYFQTFKSHLELMVNALHGKEVIQRVNIYFQPFAYGQDFYDQPYDESGKKCTIEELQTLLA